MRCGSDLLPAEREHYDLAAPADNCPRATYTDPQRLSIITHQVEATVSIVRVGMAEDGKFADGYEAIFGKKPAGAKAAKKPLSAAKKPTGKAGAKKDAKKK